MKNNKFAKGYALFQKLHGGLTAEKVVDDISAISPELSHYTMEWIFADLYSNETIDMKLREVSNLSSLVAIGALPQLRNHIYSALKLGFTIEEVKQIILNNIIIVGFPKVVNALMLLKSIVEKEGVNSGAK